MRWVKYFLFANYLFFASAYLFLNKPGNVPDEPAHVAYIRYWSVTGQQPTFERSNYWPRYEAHQPPLYYAVGRMVLSPLLSQSIATQYRVLRGIGLLCHFLLLWVIWKIAGMVFGEESVLAVGTLACAALNPMVSFVGASVSNDAMSNLWMAGVLWMGLRLEAQPEDRTSAAALALLTGLACLTKMNVVFPCLGVYIYLALRRRMSPAWLTISFLLILVLAGPVFWRNQRFLGDPLGVSAIHKMEPRAQGWGGFGHYVLISFQSFWATTGWMSITASPFFYLGLWALLLLSIAGLYRFWKGMAYVDMQHKMLLMFMAGLCLFQGLGHGLSTMQSQGRYLFVGLGAFLSLFFAGLSLFVQNFSKRVQRMVWMGLLLFAMGLESQMLVRTAASSPMIPGVTDFKIGS